MLLPIQPVIRDRSVVNNRLLHCTSKHDQKNGMEIACYFSNDMIYY